MAVTVYTLKKPELTVTLQSGGTLLADTTYYIFGYFRNKIGSGYHDYGNSPFGVIQSFTTTTVNRSISVYWKTTYNITGFENAGGGLLRVLSAEHNLATGNEIIIENGVYAGTYTITRENYNSFTIVIAYSSTYATTFRCENGTVGKYGATFASSGVSIVLYISTTNPYYSDTIYDTLTAKYSHAYYSVGYATNNIVITSEYNTQYYNAFHFSVKYWGHVLPAWCKVRERGQPTILCDANDTANDIKQAIIDAKIEDLAYATDFEIVSYGSIFYIGVASTVTFSNISIKMLLSVLSIKNDRKYYLIFNKCTYVCWYIPYKAYVDCAANDSQLFLSGMERIPIGNNNTYILQLSINIYIASLAVEGKLFENAKVTFLTTSGFLLALMSKADAPTMQFECYINNIEITNAYLITDISGNNYGVLRPAKNVTINSNYSFDVQPTTRIMAYPDMYFENINTSRANNEKFTYMTYTNPLVDRVHYMRKGIINVKNTLGVAISGADIQIKDNTGRLYTGTTDINGQFTYDVEEQLSTKPLVYMLVAPSVLYNNFEITVSKSGMQTSKEVHTSLKGKDVVDIFLLEPVEVPMVETIINANIISDQIECLITE